MNSDSTFAYLRRMNPLPRPVPVDGTDLYERITALPLDERLKDRRSPHRRRIALAAVALAAMALLATTAFAISGWLGDAVKPAITKHEYKAAQGELTLPPGTTWPSLHVDPNSVTGRGAGGGHAVLVAMSAWECYWVTAIRSGDQGEQQQAETTLNGLLRNNVLVAPAEASENWTPPNPPDIPFVVFADDGGVQYKQAMYADAAAGNPHDLTQSCRANGP